MPVQELTGTALIVSAIVAILIGIAFCFFGYRIFRILLAILGFIGGAAAGVAIVTAILAQQQAATGGTLYLILGGVIGGILGAVLLIFAYFIGIFILGAILGAGIGYAITSALTSNQTTLTVAVIALGLLGGILALVLQRVLIIIATAFSGAWSIVQGVTLLLPASRTAGTGPISSQLQAPTTSNLLPLIAWLVLGVLGVLVQFLWTGKKKPKPAPVAAVPAGTVVGGTPQVNVVVQQPTPAPIIVQAPPQATPAIPAPEQATPPAAAAGMDRFCPNCGQALSSPVAFCPKCGNPVAALWQ